MPPFFSIVIPTYNAASTIAKCLDSVAAQDSACEVVLVDGCSDDATLQLVEGFRDKIDLTIISEPDMGIYDAINKGIAQIRGQYVVVLGADDELVRDALKVVEAIACTYQADVYAGQALRVGADGEHILSVDICDERVLVGHIPFCHNAMFASRKSYERIGNYDISYKVSADAHWVHKAIQFGLKFHKVDTVLTRFHAGGVSANADVTMPECYRLIKENFSFLDIEEAKYLLFMSKGWNDGTELELLLAKYPAEGKLARSARLALDFAPHCAQQRLERALYSSASLWHRCLRRLKGLL